MGSPEKEFDPYRTETLRCPGKHSCKARFWSSARRRAISNACATESFPV
jgi:hypothetical protein